MKMIATAALCAAALALVPPVAAADAPAAKAAVTHAASGTVVKIDAAAGMVKLKHGPVASLKWPAMVMDFKLGDKAAASGLKAGQAVDFDFVESGVDYLITRIAPAK